MAQYYIKGIFWIILSIPNQSNISLSLKVFF